MVLKKLLKKTNNETIDESQKYSKNSQTCIDNTNKDKNSITTETQTPSFLISDQILDKYADVMVNFALNDGEGVREGQVVEIIMHESAKEMLLHLQQKVLNAGAFPIIRFLPHGVSRNKFENGSDEQISYMPDNMIRGRIEDVDCTINIISEIDKEELKGIDPKKIMLSQKSIKKYRDLMVEKEQKGKFFWTLCLFGTPQMAQEVGLSLEEYWDEIAKACFLYEEDPVKKWKEVHDEIIRVRERLNELDINKVHIVAKDTDLWISIGENRRWLGGTGHNIPSFEIFISPDYTGTQGHIQLTQPLYRYGNIIKDVYLEFENGIVTKSSASQGEDVLKEMIAQEGANKVGEFSLTDSRISQITRFMGETLFDENVGGRYGNTHIALGMAYKESYAGESSDFDEKKWDELGFNNSSVHTDIVATSDRTVTALLNSGEEKVIYKDGKFVI